MVRIGLAALAALNLWWGVWARFAPRDFFETFPGLGHRWTAAYPPYNEHLVTDLGSTFLTLAFLLVVATALNDNRVRWTVLSGVLVFGLLHLGFHASDRGTMQAADFGLSLVTLVAGFLIPAALLGFDLWRSEPRTAQRPPSAARDHEVGGADRP